MVRERLRGAERSREVGDVEGDDEAFTRGFQIHERQV